jgi:hypothetical protein
VIVLRRGERVDLCLFLVSGDLEKDQGLCGLWWRRNRTVAKVIAYSGVLRAISGWFLCGLGEFVEVGGESLEGRSCRDGGSVRVVEESGGGGEQCRSVGGRKRVGFDHLGKN